jgi:perosamine synthetase
MATSTVSKTAPSLTPEAVVDRIRAALPPSEGKAALHEPRFVGNERRYLNDCIDTTWVSYGGAYVEQFERAIAEACGAKHAVAVTSGTVALQVALSVAGSVAGTEVLVPALTFVASANAIVHAGGIPHFVDVEEASFGMCPVALAAHLERIGEVRSDGLYNRVTHRRISALLPVHVFGHPADMDALTAVANRYGLLVVEDATEALGSRYKGRPCGSLAPVAVLSFNGNKIVTAGGGGAVLTDDAGLARRIRHLTTTAKEPHPWAFSHDDVGWNFRMPNVNAALGLAQIECLPQALAAKRRLHQRYVEAFSDLPGLCVFTEVPFVQSNYWLVSLVLDRDQTHLLEPILRTSNADGLATRPAWIPMHQLPMYKENLRAPLSVTENLVRRIVNIPSSQFLAPA